MASTESELKDQVRELTDYTSTGAFSADALSSVFEIAKRDIQAEANTTVDSWVDNESDNAENALFWTACLFTKIKAGEIGGVPMSLGDIDLDSLKASGDAVDDSAVIWYEKASTYTDRLIEKGGRFGVTRVNRPGTNRSYGDESPLSDSVDYGGDV